MSMKHCPMCGRTQYLGYATVEDMLAPYGTGDVSSYVLKQVCVICSATKGGCGTSSGYALSKDDALELWNRRTVPHER